MSGLRTCQRSRSVDRVKAFPEHFAQRSTEQRMVVHAVASDRGNSPDIDHHRRRNGALVQGLGVVVGAVAVETAAALGLDRGRGALVTDVRPDAPGALGGLEVGDVIVAFDGTPIERWDDLPWLAATAGSDRPVSVQVQRAEGSRELIVTLTPYAGP